MNREDGRLLASDGATTAERLASIGLRWPVAAALLLVENLAIGLRVDARALTGRGAYGFDHLGTVAIVLLVSVVFTALVRGTRLVDDLREARATGRTAGTWALVGLHGLSYAVLWTLSVRLFDAPADEAIAPMRLVAWATAALSTVGSVVPLVVARGRLFGLLERLAPSLAVGTTSAVAAVMLGKTSTQLWASFGHYTLDASAWALARVTPEVVYDNQDFVLGTPAFVVRLAPVCSGFEGMGLIAALLTGYISINRRALRLPHVLIMVPLGVAAVWFANVGRIVALIMIGTHGSPAVAVGGFHSQAGWVLFCIVAIAAVLTIQASPWLSSTGASGDSDGEAADTPGLSDAGDEGDHASAYLLPLLALIAASMLTGLAAADIDLLYGVRILAAASVLVAYRRAYRSILVRPDLASVGIGILVYALWVGLVPTATDGGNLLRLRVSEMDAVGATLWLSLRVVGAVLVIPVVEELAFRHYLLRRLSSSRFLSVPLAQVRWAPLLISSLAFGLLHGAWLAGTLAGLAFGLAQGRRGHTSDAITAHAVANGLIAVQVLALGHWGLWS